MLNSKERAFLRGKASLESAICFVGKEGLTDEVFQSINQALVARELVKVAVLQNCDTPAKEVAKQIEAKLGAQVVGVVGKKIVAYKFNAKSKSHILQR